jgi:predicted metal-dependent hydrolase
LPVVTDIVVRKVKFDFPDELDDVFPGGDIVAECYLAAFSLTMPSLEPYLIRTYRALGDRITDPALASDVKQFIAQEAQHHRNHSRVNAIIKSRLDPQVAAKLQKIEDALESDYRRFNAKKSDRYNAVYAEGFEAMTCAMVVSSFEQAAGGNGPTRFGPWQQLWAWHGAEEIEHRTVAFDVYESMYGSYLYRVLGSLRAQMHFSRYIDRLQRVLLRAHGKPARPHLPSWVRTGWRNYLRTFRRRYNPADIQPDPLVGIVLSMYAPDGSV